MVKTPVCARRSYRFLADHPFVFLIRDNRTERILFMGRVTNPNEWAENPGVR